MPLTGRGRFINPGSASQRVRPLECECAMGKPSPQLQTLKAEFFRALANPIRIRLLEVLVAGPDRSVQDLQHMLDIEQPIVSQQLARLRASGIVVARGRGAATRYAVTDPLLKDLLQ